MECFEPRPYIKYELLIKIKNQFSLTNIRINNNSKLSLDKSLISKRKINYIVPSYDIMINELFDYIHLNKQLYNSYLNESKRT